VGKAVVESLAKDLQKGFPEMRRFFAENIWAMRRFFSEYGRPEFLQQLLEEMPGPSEHKTFQPRVPDLGLLELEAPGDPMVTCAESWR
jgi:hypothetical protein